MSQVRVPCVENELVCPEKGLSMMRENIDDSLRKESLLTKLDSMNLLRGATLELFAWQYSVAAAAEDP